MDEDSFPDLYSTRCMVYSLQHTLYLFQIVNLFQAFHDELHFVAVVHAQLDGSVEDAMIA